MPLSVCLRRRVLDPPCVCVCVRLQAHKIKGRTNNTAKSVYALRASFRWCLSGTPLQNRVSELYALIRFLKAEPFSCYFCSIKGCKCKSNNWQMGVDGKGCQFCGHPPMRHFSYFNKHIVNPIKRYGGVGIGRKALLLLKDEVLHNVCLRRTKEERAADLKLPPLEVVVEKLELDEIEQDFYDCIYKQTRSKFDTYVDKGVLLHNYAHIFELLSRLRQAADHPYLIVHGRFRGQVAPLPSRSAGRSDVCGICTYGLRPSMTRPLVRLGRVSAVGGQQRSCVD